MQKQANKFRILFFFMAVWLWGNPCLQTPSYGQQEQVDPSKDGQQEQVDPAKEGIPVELNGDQVEFSIEENKIYAKGNVVMTRKDTKLMCDEIEFSRDTKVAVAEGNVILDTGQGTISGEKMVFNFDTMTGTFMGAKIYAAPYYGAAEKMSKVSDTKIVMENGYLTTSDFDDPEYRLPAKTVDVFPGKKVTARSVKLLIGKVPLMYIPKYTQVLSDKKPRFLFTPGYDKDWGAFLLQKWRYWLNDNVKGIIHLDYRERKDFASGFDVEYNTVRYGSGVIKTYYMNERNITSKRVWDEKPSPTIERERYKIEWRHKWKIDDTSDAVLQYYNLSDNTFLKDYFEREYDKEANPASYFVYTKTLPRGTLSFRSDFRVNRFTSAVEKLPEISYDSSNQRIGNTKLYFKSQTTYSNLTSKTASPSEVRQNTMRVHTDNEISYPFRFSIFELKPFVGGRQTYYSKTKEKTKYNVVRSVFDTGADISTKFFKVFDAKADFWGMEINRLRHIVTPSVAYRYTHEPTIPSSQFDQFDGFDSIARAHKLTFSVENKLQTKREGKNVDLLRFILDTDFALKDNPSSGGFNTINADIEFKPTDWLTFYHDASYDTQKERLSSANFQLYINGGKWYLDLEKRYHVDADDQITTEWGYRINPKWKIRVYERFDLDTGTLKEQNYGIVRDLHSWEMELNFNEQRGEGDEIWMVFRLKAFPEMAVDFGASFNKRKPGSQSN